jgi:UDP-N-acetylmuramoyl-L-alanyl-D-glutamate--2,6-diaminopimelate ligase
VATRIINVDDPFGAALAARLAAPVMTYGIEAGEVRAEAITADANGQRFHITGLGAPIDVVTRAVGRFNIHNLLAVACVLHAEGVPAERIGALLAGLPAVPGRMQRVEMPTGPGSADGLDVFVDYAHTPDALAKALATLRPQTRGRLWVVFGCGGSRDRTKRPIMGAIAAEGADQVIITSDNPRFEAPEAIIADIVGGVPSDAMTRVRVEADRATAIDLAIGQAQAGDTVLIAGKGHETYQEIAGVRRHFDDMEVARQALRARAERLGVPHV